MMSIYQKGSESTRILPHLHTSSPRRLYRFGFACRGTDDEKMNDDEN
jgi:hypothetical protein